MLPKDGKMLKKTTPRLTKTVGMRTNVSKDYKARTARKPKPITDSTRQIRLGLKPTTTCRQQKRHKAEPTKT